MYLLGHIIGWLWLMLTVAIGLSRHSVVTQSNQPIAF